MSDALCIGLVAAMFVSVVYLLVALVWVNAKKNQAEGSIDAYYKEIKRKETRINELVAEQYKIRDGLTLDGWVERTAYLEDEVKSYKVVVNDLAVENCELRNTLTVRNFEIEALQTKLEMDPEERELIDLETALVVKEDESA